MTTRLVAGFLLGVAILVGCFTCVREAESEPTVVVVVVTRAEADLNDDLDVNVLDFRHAALCWGPVSEEPCSTPTVSPSPVATSEPPTATSSPTAGPPTMTATLESSPTFTQSPSATPTATPTATSTLTPTAASSYGIDQLLYDSARTSPHEGCLSLDPARGVDGYDWEEFARPGGTPIASHLTPWWQIAIDHCPTGAYDSTPPIPSGSVELRNFKAYALTSTWVPIGSGPQLGQWGNYTIGFRGSCSGWTATGFTWHPSSDPVCIAHGWVYPRSLKPSGYQCFVVTIEARGAGFLLNVGMDSYDGDTYRGDIGIGRFIRLTSDWSTVGATSCSEALLRANPPPF